jgi:hypothetical protein
MRVFLITIFLPIIVTAQTIPDIGEIRIDTVFDCNKYRGIEMSLGAPSICDSKNDFEFRLICVYRPHGNRELIVLSCNDNQWEIKKYSSAASSYGRLIVISTFDTMSVHNSYVHPFVMLLDTLIHNKAFLIPNQSELLANHNILDGSLYILTFKIGNKFRQYSYDNPETNLEYFPRQIEYIRLKNIIMTFRNFF